MAQVRLARRTELARRREYSLPKAPRQFDLILDDARLRGATPAERQAMLRALARLLLETSGAAKRKVSDDNA